jgi:hypothetical protein
MNQPTPITVLEASKKYCPMRMNNPTIERPCCLATNCMAFQFVENGYEWDDDTGESIPVRLYRCAIPR